MSRQIEGTHIHNQLETHMGTQVGRPVVITTAPNVTVTTMYTACDAEEDDHTGWIQSHPEWQQKLADWKVAAVEHPLHAYYPQSALCSQLVAGSIGLKGRVDMILERPVKCNSNDKNKNKSNHYDKEYSIVDYKTVGANSWPYILQQGGASGYPGTTPVTIRGITLNNNSFNKTALQASLYSEMFIKFNNQPVRVSAQYVIYICPELRQVAVYELPYLQEWVSHIVGEPASTLHGTTGPEAAVEPSIQTQPQTPPEEVAELLIQTQVETQTPTQTRVETEPRSYYPRAAKTKCLMLLKSIH
jgi:hypothetical protein